MIDHAVRQRGGIRAGQAITTGSWTGLRYYPPGTKARGEFVGLGERRSELLMRTVLALLLLLATPAWALSPEEAAYIAARDRAAAALEQKWDSAAHDKAIAALTPMLRRIVGPPPKGFPGPGEMVRDSLCCGAGSDKLDAIAFGDAVVTTEGLARLGSARSRSSRSISRPGSGRERTSTSG